MTSEGRVWRTTHRAIVLEGAPAKRPRALVVPVDAGTVGGGWGLPCWTVEEERTHEMKLGPVVGLARERLGIEVAVLRYVDQEEDEGALTCSGTWVLEARRVGEGEAPGGGRWMGWKEIEKVGAWGRAVEVLRELEEGVSPPGRCAWSEPGWLVEAEGWMRERLERIGRPLVGRIEQVRNNSISSVLRGPTAEGLVYFKAASRHFREEARITHGLAERFPDHLPRVLAHEAERSWMVMEDFGPALWRSPLERWEETLRIMGEMQRRNVGEADWLRSIGCADRRLALLREQIPELLDAQETRAQLDTSQHERLVRRIPQLQEACETLGAMGVPETLIHGDLHSGNVADREGHVTIFDWTDGAIGHPFLDLVTFLPDERRRPVGVEDPAAAAKHLLDVYLEGWTGYASGHELRRAVELLGTVQQLHHAQSYLQISRSIEKDDGWQWAGELGKWLEPLAV